MQYLNVFLSLLNKTQSRDKILRVVQYATIHSEQHLNKGATFSTYTHIRRTRKWLRFFAWIELLVKIRRLRREFTACKNSYAKVGKAIKILEEICKILFYLSDHLVLLGQLEILPKDMAVKYEPRSMLMYLLQNLFGTVNNLIQLMNLIQHGPQPKKQGEDSHVEEEGRIQGQKEVRGRSIQLLRCILDLMVAGYYLRKPKGIAHRVGVVGIVTSLMALAQSCNYI